jgi:hypothetical protein
MNPAIVSPVIVIAIGAYLTFSFGRDIYFGLASRRWTRIRGNICQLQTGVLPAVRGIGGGAVLGVRYEFEVDGAAYQSNRFDYAGRNSSHFAELYYALSKRGPIYVWYDPSHPARAVLVPGIQAGNVLRFMFGLVFLLGGLAWLP